jgi:hypothetical protein
MVGSGDGERYVFTAELTRRREAEAKVTRLFAWGCFFFICEFQREERERERVTVCVCLGNWWK